MKRRALLIGCPGKGNDFLPGVKKDIENYKEYLKSNNVYFKGEAISPVMFTQKLTNGKEGSYTFNKSRSSTARCIDMPSINEAKEIYGKKFSCQVPWSQNHVEVNDFFESSNNLNIKLKFKMAIVSKIIKFAVTKSF